MSINDLNRFFSFTIFKCFYQQLSTWSNMTLEMLFHICAWLRMPWVTMEIGVCSPLWLAGSQEMPRLHSSRANRWATRWWSCGCALQALNVQSSRCWHLCHAVFFFIQVWFAWLVLNMEGLFEEESQLRRCIENELLAEANITPEQALKVQRCN